MWEFMPDNVLAKIFSHLDVIGKLEIRDVCTTWRQALDHPDVWRTLVLKAEHFERFKTWNIPLEILLSNLKSCQHLHIDISCLEACNLMEVASTSCRNLRHVKIAKSYLRLDIDHEKFKVLSKSLKTLLSQNTRLKDVDIDNVAIVVSSQNEPLPLGLPHAHTLRRLRMVNSLESCSPSSLMYLVWLTELTISPQFLHYRLIEHLAEFSLKRLNIINKPKIPESQESLTKEQWASLTKKSDLAVGCYRMKSIHMSHDWGERMLAPSMPLASLIYNNAWLPYTALLPYLDTFASTLEELVDFSLSLTKEGAHVDCDQKVISFIKKNPAIRTLSLRCVLSTKTILLMVILNPRLLNLPIRADLISFDDNTLDLDEYPEIGPENRRFIEINCSTTESFESAMSAHLGQPWRLIDKQEYQTWMRERYCPYFGELLV